jgi:hypothetical protein
MRMVHEISALRHLFRGVARRRQIAAENEPQSREERKASREIYRQGAKSAKHRIQRKARAAAARAFRCR